MNGITAVSLFAGVGGIDRALEAASIRVTTAVEIDRDCQGVLARHFPHTRVRTDVTEVTGDDLIADGFVPGRGILAAGWPCQGNSVAGRRGGLGDARSGLWRHVVRLLAETRPRWFLGENVPGLYSVRGGADIAVVRNDLAQLGYWWAERILDAQHFGVPQRRSRIFFVGCAGDGAAPVEVLLEPEGRAGHSAARRAARAGAARRAPGGTGDAGTVGTFGGSGPGGGWRVGSDEAAAGQLVAEPVIAHETGAGWWTAGAGTLRSEGGGGTGQGGHLVVNALTPGTHGRGTSGYPAENGHLVAATIQGGGRRGHRIDAEGAAGGHLILSQNGSDIQTGDQLGALTAGMARQTSGDLIAFDTVQITSGENRSNPRPGDPSPTLNGNGATCTSPLPFSVGETSAAITAHHGKGPDSDATNGLILDATPPLAATLTSGRAASGGVNDPGRRHEDDYNLIAHALTSGGSDASEDGTGRGTPLVPYGPVPSSLAVAGDFSTGENVAQTVRSAHGQPGCDTSGLAVRRLTPVECERLQGLPDQWTRWKLVGGELIEQSDSARYRQIGNSVAVPCVAWITRRIAAYDQPQADREAS